jgi:hypothetical protein
MRKTVATALAVVAARAMGSAHAAPVIFDLTGATTAAGPPYPSGNVGFDMHEAAAAGPGSPIGTLLVHLDGASGDLPLSLSASLSRTGALVGIALSNPPAAGFPGDITINPCWDVNPLEGSTPALVDPPTTAQEGDGSVDVFFAMDMGDGSVTRMRAHFAIGAGQPFSFGPVTAALGNSIDASLHLLLDAGGTPDAGSPLFTMEFTGDLVAAPEPAALALFGLGLAALGALRRRRATRG